MKHKSFLFSASKKQFYFSILTILIAGCSAPRVITHSGKVTPYKQFKIGGNFSGNISTSTIGSIYDGAQSTATSLISKDSITLDETIPKLNKTALAYSLDPLGTGFDFYIRYGIYKHFDIGYKYASGVHVFDAMYQFMGSTNPMDNPGEKGLYGSVGIQYSGQSYDLPFGLDKVQEVLGYSMSRKDILIPVVFSKSFGDEEKIGNVSFGVAYSHSFIEYGFDPKNIFYTAASSQYPLPVDAIQGKNNFGAVGGFLNLKLGYKYVYILPAISVFYQNYGTYQMLGGQSTNLSGFTFIPSVGLQFNIFKLPSLKKKTPAAN